MKIKIKVILEQSFEVDFDSIAQEIWDNLSDIQYDSYNILYSLENEYLIQLFSKYINPKYLEDYDFYDDLDDTGYLMTPLRKALDKVIEREIKSIRDDLNIQYPKLNLPESIGIEYEYIKFKVKAFEEVISIMNAINNYYSDTLEFDEMKNTGKVYEINIHKLNW